MVIVIALASALCYGAAMVLQQHSAVEADADLSLHAGLVADLAVRPIWLAGVVANVAGFGLRFVALGIGSLVVVQPVLATSILFALPVSARWHHLTMGRREWIGAVCIAAGIALFIVSGQPTRGRADASALAWLVSGVVVAVIAGTLIALGRRQHDRRRATLLAGAGGVLLASIAALAKVTATEPRSEHLHLLATWQPYALVVVAAVGVVVVQSAFGAAPLSASLPVLMVVEPLASIILGVALLGERVTSGIAAWSGASIGLAAMAIGIVLVAGSPSVAGGQGRVDPAETTE